MKERDGFILMIRDPLHRMRRCKGIWMNKRESYKRLEITVCLLKISQAEVVLTTGRAWSAREVVLKGICN